MTMFRPRTDGFVRAMTLGVIALLSLVVLAATRFALADATDSMRVWPVALVFVLVGGVVAVAYGYAPRRYRVNDHTLWIERPFGDLSFPLCGLREVERLDLWLGLCRKTLPGGNSGLFGLYGSFYRKELGTFYMHARSASGGVLLRWDDVSLVVAPERRDEFASVVRRAAGEATKAS